VVEEGGGGGWWRRVVEEGGGSKCRGWKIQVVNKYRPKSIMTLGAVNAPHFLRVQEPDAGEGGAKEIAPEHHLE
jgi:hypothetical protein